jgi:AcrR family transcriptional regulator
VTRGLTKAAIVTAALGALDETGLDGLTVRVVAARLGVQPPALYWHVRSKQDLLDEMATEIWRQVSTALDALDPGLSWDQVLTAFATIARQVLLSHRDGAKMASGTYLTDPAVLRRQEAGLASLADQGFAVADVVRAYQLLYSFTIGFCIEEQAVAQAGDERYSLANRAERVGADAHPLVVEAGPAIFGDPGTRFADLVAILVDAAGRLRG